MLESTRSRNSVDQARSHRDPGTSGLRHTTPIRRAIEESFVSGFRCVMAIGAALTFASAVTAVVSIQRERG
jgi:hypothetical protein